MERLGSPRAPTANTTTKKMHVKISVTHRTQDFDFGDFSAPGRFAKAVLGRWRSSNVVRITKIRSR